MIRSVLLATFFLMFAGAGQVSAQVAQGRYEFTAFTTGTDGTTATSIYVGLGDTFTVGFGIRFLGTTPTNAPTVDADGTPNQLRVFGADARVFEGRVEIGTAVPEGVVSHIAITGGDMSAMLAPTASYEQGGVNLLEPTTGREVSLTEDSGNNAVVYMYLLGMIDEANRVPCNADECVLEEVIRVAYRVSDSASLSEYTIGNIAASSTSMQGFDSYNGIPDITRQAFRVTVLPRLTLGSIDVPGSPGSTILDIEEGEQAEVLVSLDEEPSQEVSITVTAALGIASREVTVQLTPSSHVDVQAIFNDLDVVGAWRLTAAGVIENTVIGVDDENAVLVNVRQQGDARAAFNGMNAVLDTSRLDVEEAVASVTVTDENAGDGLAISFDVIEWRVEIGVAASLPSSSDILFSLYDGEGASAAGTPTITADSGGLRVSFSLDTTASVNATSATYELRARLAAGLSGEAEIDNSQYVVTLSDITLASGSSDPEVNLAGAQGSEDRAGLMVEVTGTELRWLNEVGSDLTFASPPTPTLSARAGEPNTLLLEVTDAAGNRELDAVQGSFMAVVVGELGQSVLTAGDVLEEVDNTRAGVISANWERWPESDGEVVQLGLMLGALVTATTAVVTTDAVAERFFSEQQIDNALGSIPSGIPTGVIFNFRAVDCDMGDVNNAQRPCIFDPDYMNPSASVLNIRWDSNELASLELLGGIEASTGHIQLEFVVDGLAAGGGPGGEVVNTTVTAVLAPGVSSALINYSTTLIERDSFSQTVSPTEEVIQNLSLDAPNSVGMGASFDVEVQLSQPVPEDATVTVTVLADGASPSPQTVTLRAGQSMAMVSFQAPAVRGVVQLSATGTAVVARPDMLALRVNDAPPVTVMVDMLLLLMLEELQASVAVGQDYSVRVSADIPVPAGTTVTVTVSAGTGSEQQQEVFLTATISSMVVSFTAPARAGEVVVMATGMVSEGVLVARDAVPVITTVTPAVLTLSLEDVDTGATLLNGSAVNLLLESMPIPPAEAGEVDVTVTAMTLDNSLPAAMMNFMLSSTTSTISISFPSLAPATWVFSAESAVPEVIEFDGNEPSVTIQGPVIVQVTPLPPVVVVDDRNARVLTDIPVAFALEASESLLETVSVTLVLIDTASREISVSTQITTGTTAAQITVDAALLEEGEWTLSAMAPAAGGGVVLGVTALQVVRPQIVLNPLSDALALLGSTLTVEVKTADQVPPGLSQAAVVTVTATLDPDDGSDPVIVSFPVSLPAGRAPLGTFDIGGSLTAQAGILTFTALVDPESASRPVATATLTVERLDVTLDLIVSTPSAAVEAGSTFSVTVETSAPVPAGAGAEVSVVVTFEQLTETAVLSAGMEMTSVEFTAPGTTGTFIVNAAGTASVMRPDALGLTVNPSSASVEVVPMAIALTLDAPGVVDGDSSFTATVGTDPALPAGTVVMAAVQFGSEGPTTVTLSAAEPIASVEFTAPSSDLLSLTASVTNITQSSPVVAVAPARVSVQVTELATLGLTLSTPSAAVAAGSTFSVTVGANAPVPTEVSVMVTFDGFTRPELLSASAATASVVFTAPDTTGTFVVNVTGTATDTNALRLTVNPASASVQVVPMAIALTLTPASIVARANAMFSVEVGTEPALPSGTEVAAEVQFDSEDPVTVMLSAASPTASLTFTAPSSGLLSLTAEVSATTQGDIAVEVLDATPAMVQVTELVTLQLTLSAPSAPVVAGSTFSVTVSSSPTVPTGAEVSVVLTFGESMETAVLSEDEGMTMVEFTAPGTTGTFAVNAAGMPSVDNAAALELTVNPTRASVRVVPVAIMLTLAAPGVVDVDSTFTATVGTDPALPTGTEVAAEVRFGSQESITVMLSAITPTASLDFTAPLLGLLSLTAEVSTTTQGDIAVEVSDATPAMVQVTDLVTLELRLTPPSAPVEAGSTFSVTVSSDPAVPARVTVSVNLTFEEAMETAVLSENEQMVMVEFTAPNTTGTFTVNADGMPSVEAGVALELTVNPISASVEVVPVAIALTLTPTSIVVRANAMFSVELGTDRDLPVGTVANVDLEFNGVTIPSTLSVADPTARVDFTAPSSDLLSLTASVTRITQSTPVVAVSAPAPVPVQVTELVTLGLTLSAPGAVVAGSIFGVTVSSVPDVPVGAAVSVMVTFNGVMRPAELSAAEQTMMVEFTAPGMMTGSFPVSAVGTATVDDATVLEVTVNPAAGISVDVAPVVVALTLTPTSIVVPANAMFSVEVGTDDDLPDGTVVPVDVQFGSGPPVEVMLSVANSTASVEFTAPSFGLLSLTATVGDITQGDPVVAVSEPAPVPVQVTELATLGLTLSAPTDPVEAGSVFSVMVTADMPVPAGAEVSVVLTFEGAMETAMLSEGEEMTTVDFTAPDTTGTFPVTSTDPTSVTNPDVLQLELTLTPPTVSVPVVPMAIMLTLDAPAVVDGGSPFTVTVATNPALPPNTEVTAEVQLDSEDPITVMLDAAANRNVNLDFIAPLSGPLSLTAEESATIQGDITVEVSDAAPAMVQVTELVTLGLTLSTPTEAVEAGSTFMVTVGADAQVPTEVSVMVEFNGFTVTEPVTLSVSEQTMMVELTAPDTTGTFVVNATGTAVDTNALRLTVNPTSASVQVVPMAIALTLTPASIVARANAMFSVEVGTDPALPPNTEVAVEVQFDSEEPITVMLSAASPTASLEFTAPLSGLLSLMAEVSATTQGDIAVEVSNATPAMVQVTELVTLGLTLSAPTEAVVAGSTFSVTVSSSPTVPAGAEVSVVLTFGGSTETAVLSESEDMTMVEFTAPGTTGTFAVNAAGMSSVDNAAALELTVTPTSASVQVVPVAVVLTLAAPGVVDGDSTFTATVGTDPALPAGTVVAAGVQFDSEEPITVMLSAITPTASLDFTAPPEGLLELTAEAGEITQSSPVVAVAPARVSVQVTELVTLGLTLSAPSAPVEAGSAFSVTVSSAPEVPVGATVMVIVHFEGTDISVELTSEMPSTAVMLIAPSRIVSDLVLTASGTATVADSNVLRVTVADASAMVNIVPQEVQLMLMVSPKRVNIGEEIEVTVGVSPSPLTGTTLTVLVAFGEESTQQVTLSNTTSSQEVRFTVSASAVGPQEVSAQVTVEPEGLVVVEDAPAQTVTVRAEGTVDLTLDAPENVTVGDVFTVTVGVAEGTPLPESMSVTATVSFIDDDGERIGEMEAALTRVQSTTAVQFMAPVTAGIFVVEVSGSTEASTAINFVVGASAQVSVEPVRVTLTLSDPSPVTVDETYQVMVDTNIAVPLGTTLEVTVSDGTTSREVSLTEENAGEEIFFTAPASAGQVTVTATATVQTSTGSLQVAVADAAPLTVMVEAVLLSLQLQLLDVPEMVVARDSFTVTVSSEPEVPEGATVTVTVNFDGADSNAVELSAEMPSVAVMLTAPGRLENGLALMTLGGAETADPSALQVTVADASATVNIVPQSVQLTLAVPADPVDLSREFPITVGVFPPLLADTTLLVVVTFGDATEQITLTDMESSQEARFTALRTGVFNVRASAEEVEPAGLVTVADAEAQMVSGAQPVVTLTFIEAGPLPAGSEVSLAVGLSGLPSGSVDVTVQAERLERTPAEQPEPVRVELTAANSYDTVATFPANTLLPGIWQFTVVTVAGPVTAPADGLELAIEPPLVSLSLPVSEVIVGSTVAVLVTAAPAAALEGMVTVEVIAALSTAVRVTAQVQLSESAPEETAILSALSGAGNWMVTVETITPDYAAAYDGTTQTLTARLPRLLLSGSEGTADPILNIPVNTTAMVLVSAEAPGPQSTVMVTVTAVFDTSTQTALAILTPSTYTNVPAVFGVDNLLDQAGTWQVTAAATSLGIVADASAVTVRVRSEDEARVDFTGFATELDTSMDGDTTVLVASVMITDDADDGSAIGFDVIEWNVLASSADLAANLANIDDSDVVFSLHDNDGNVVNSPTTSSVTNSEVRLSFTLDTMAEIDAEGMSSAVYELRAQLRSGVQNRDDIDNSEYTIRLFDITVSTGAAPSIDVAGVEGITASLRIMVTGTELVWVDNTTRTVVAGQPLQLALQQQDARGNRDLDVSASPLTVEVFDSATSASMLSTDGDSTSNVTVQQGQVQFNWARWPAEDGEEVSIEAVLGSLRTASRIAVVTDAVAERFMSTYRLEISDGTDAGNTVAVDSLLNTVISALNLSVRAVAGDADCLAEDALRPCVDDTGYTGVLALTPTWDDSQFALTIGGVDAVSSTPISEMPQAPWISGVLSVASTLTATLSGSITQSTLTLTIADSGGVLEEANINIPVTERPAANLEFTQAGDPVLLDSINAVTRSELLATLRVEDSLADGLPVRYNTFTWQIEGTTDAVTMVEEGQLAITMQEEDGTSTPAVCQDPVSMTDDPSRSSLECLVTFSPQELNTTATDVIMSATYTLQAQYIGTPSITDGLVYTFRLDAIGTEEGLPVRVSVSTLADQDVQAEASVEGTLLRWVDATSRTVTTDDEPLQLALQQEDASGNLDLDVSASALTVEVFDSDTGTSTLSTDGDVISDVTVQRGQVQFNWQRWPAEDGEEVAIEAVLGSLRTASRITVVTDAVAERLVAANIMVTVQNVLGDAVPVANLVDSATNTLRFDVRAVAGGASCLADAQRPCVDDRDYTEGLQLTPSWESAQLSNVVINDATATSGASMDGTIGTVQWEIVPTLVGSTADFSIAVASGSLMMVSIPLSVLPPPVPTVTLQPEAQTLLINMAPTVTAMISPLPPMPVTITITASLSGTSETVVSDPAGLTAEDPIQQVSLAALAQAGDWRLEVSIEGEETDADPGDGASVRVLAAALPVELSLSPAGEVAQGTEVQLSAMLPAGTATESVQLGVAITAPDGTSQTVTLDLAAGAAIFSAAGVMLDMEGGWEFAVVSADPEIVATGVSTAVVQAVVPVLRLSPASQTLPAGSAVEVSVVAELAPAADVVVQVTATRADNTSTSVVTEAAVTITASQLSQPAIFPADALSYGDWILSMTVLSGGPVAAASTAQISLERGMLSLTVGVRDVRSTDPVEVTVASNRSLARDVDVMVIATLADPAMMRLTTLTLSMSGAPTSSMLQPLSAGTWVISLQADERLVIADTAGSTAVVTSRDSGVPVTLSVAPAEALPGARVTLTATLDEALSISAMLMVQAELQNSAIRRTIVIVLAEAGGSADFLPDMSGEWVFQAQAAGNRLIDPASASTQLTVLETRLNFSTPARSLNADDLVLALRYITLCRNTTATNCSDTAAFEGLDLTRNLSGEYMDEQLDQLVVPDLTGDREGDVADLIILHRVLSNIPISLLLTETPEEDTSILEAIIRRAVAPLE